MAKYDAIRGAGNVTVQAPPDFWTSAKQSFDDDYDRLVAAQERKKEEERYNSETAKEEQRYNETTSTERRRYLEQQEQIEKETDREDWQYMYERMKTDAQRVTIYENGLNNGVSGLTPAGLDAIKASAATETSLNTSSQNYYAGDDEYKSKFGAKLEADLIKNNKHTQAALVTKSLKEARKNVENKEVIEMISAQYGDVFSPQLKTFFETTGDVSDAQLNMGVEMMKTSQSYKLKSMQEKFDLAKSLMDMQTKGEFPSQEQINTVSKANTMGYKLYESLTSEDGAPPKESKQLPYPTLGGIDETTTGLKNTFDDMSEERKSSEFLRVLKEVVPGGKEAWGKMEDDERSSKGIEIIDIINKKEYEPPPKVAGIGIGGEYEDPEYAGEESITNEMIDAKFEEILTKRGIVGKKRSMATKTTLKDYRNKAKSELIKEMRKKSRKKAKKAARGQFPPPGKYSFIYDE